MSTMYGGGGTTGYGPPRRVNFGWIGEAFRLFGAAPGAWVFACLVAVLLPFVLLVVLSVAVGAAGALTGGGLGGATPGGLPAAGALSGMALGFVAVVALVSLFYSPFIYGGFLRMAVRQIVGEAITFTDVFSGGPVVFKMLGLTLLLGLISYLLLFLLMVPFALAHVTAFSDLFTPSPTEPLAARLVPSVLSFIAQWLIYSFTLPAYAMVADGAGVFSALSKSLSAMRGQWPGAMGLLLAFGLLLGLSVVPCGLGLLVTLPMLYLISALAYRDMVGMPGIGKPGGLAAGDYGTPQPGVWPPPPGQAPPPNWGPPPGG